MTYIYNEYSQSLQEQDSTAKSFTTDLVFSATDNKTIVWTNWIIVIWEWNFKNINWWTINITWETYIYFDGTNTLKISNNPSTVQKANHTLVCTALDSPVGKKAIYKVDWTIWLWVLVDKDNIKARTITANEILARTITANEIAANSITTNELNFTPIKTNNIVASINASSEWINISANKISIDWTTTFSSWYNPSTKIWNWQAANDINNYTTTINWDKIKTWTVIANVNVKQSSWIDSVEMFNNSWIPTLRYIDNWINVWDLTWTYKKSITLWWNNYNLNCLSTSKDMFIWNTLITNNWFIAWWNSVFIWTVTLNSWLASNLSMNNRDILSWWNIHCSHLYASNINQNVGMNGYQLTNQGTLSFSNISTYSPTVSSYSSSFRVTKNWVWYYIDWL